MARASDKRIQLLLRLRRQHEDVSRQAFEKARSAVAAVIRRKAELDMQIQAEDDAARLALLGGAARHMHVYRESVADMTSQTTRCNRELLNIEPLMNKIKGELIEARKRRQLAETLADKLRNRSRMAAGRAEVKESDARFAAFSAQNARM